MRKFILKLLISVVILFLLFRRIDSVQFFQNLSHASLGLIGLAGFFLLIVLFLPAYAQNVLFKATAIHLRLTQIYDINLKGMFYSLILPGDLAGGVARLMKFSKAHRLSSEKEGASVSPILVVMATDRFLSMGALILPLAPLFFLAPLPEKAIWFQKTALLLSTVFLLLLFFGCRLPWGKIISRLPLRREKFIRFLENFFRLFQDIPERSLLLSFFITFVYQMGTVFIIDVLLAKSLSIHMPWLIFISIAAAIRFVRYIPVTVSGIGVREGLFPFFLQFFGIPFEKALALGTLGTALVIFVGILGGILELIEINFKKT